MKKILLFCIFLIGSYAYGMEETYQQENDEQGRCFVGLDELRAVRLEETTNACKYNPSISRELFPEEGYEARIGSKRLLPKKSLKRKRIASSGKSVDSENQETFVCPPAPKRKRTVRGQRNFPIDLIVPLLPPHNNDLARNIEPNRRDQVYSGKSLIRQAAELERLVDVMKNGATDYSDNNNDLDSKDEDNL